jgi:hypothetical protein
VPEPVVAASPVVFGSVFGMAVSPPAGSRRRCSSVRGRWVP